jgi:DNA-binding response OmpR family regulator
VSRQVIAERLGRPGKLATDTAIEIHVHRLRRLLAPFGFRIRTLRGFGYALDPIELVNRGHR